MSLLLRQAGQEILDQYNLPQFNVGIDHNNYMTIQSECGKPFLTIVGVHFTRANPTAKEIEYSVELLDNFLATHIQLINKYLKDKAAFSKKKPPAKEKEITQIKLTFETWSKELDKYTDIHYIKYIDGPIQIYHEIKNKRSSHKTAFSEQIKPELLTPWKFNKKLHEKIVKCLKTHIKYEEEKRALEAMKEQLSVCNI